MVKTFPCLTTSISKSLSSIQPFDFGVPFPASQNDDMVAGLTEKSTLNRNALAV